MSCLAVAKYFMYQSVNSCRGDLSSYFISSDVLEVHRAVVVPIDLVPEAQHPILRQIRARRAVEQLVNHVFELHEVLEIFKYLVNVIAKFHNLWFFKEMNLKKSLAKSGHGHHGEIPPAQLHGIFSAKLMAERPKCCFSTICTDTGVT